MTANEIKQFAKEKYNRELTDAEAEEVLKEVVKEGALGEEELGKVSGGISGHAGDTLSYVIGKVLENTKRNPRR